MIYTDMTRKAMKLAFAVHKEQVDKTGVPYIYHPIHLAEQMPDENTVCVALLHDVVEDGEVTLEDLEREGFPREVVTAIGLLTHGDDVPYMEYVAKIKADPLARAVKLADLSHNSDLTRLPRVTKRDRERTKKYKAAIELLTAEDKAAD